MVVRVLEDGQFDRIIVLEPRRKDGHQEQLPLLVVGEHDRFGDTHLVSGEGASLVGAQHVHAGKLLYGNQTADDRFLAGQVCGADGHRHRQHSG